MGKVVTFWFFWVIFGVIFGLGVLNLCEIDGWAGIQGEFSLELGMILYPGKKVEEMMDFGWCLD